MKKIGLENYLVSDAGCWEYQGFLLPNGYSRVKWDGKIRLGHRASWSKHVGPIPEGMCVLHKCDNRRCINPEHLFIGTKKDNTQDMLAKRRHGVQRLFKHDVWHMKRLKYSGMKYRQLANLFACSESNVQKIMRGSR